MGIKRKKGKHIHFPEINKILIYIKIIKTYLKDCKIYYINKLKKIRYWSENLKQLSALYYFCYTVLEYYSDYSLNF